MLPILITLLLLAPACTHAFVAPSTAARGYTDAAVGRAHRTHLAAAGKGFQDKALFGVGQASPDPTLWAKEYKSFVKRCGAYICSLSWEAYSQQGRGAVYANYDGGKAAGTLSEAEEKLGGIPSMYCPLEEFVNMMPKAAEANEHADLDQIIRRIKSYDPEKEFVVVFQAGGVCGTDICKPNIPPPEMAQQVLTQADLAAATNSSQRVSMGSDGRLGISYGATGVIHTDGSEDDNEAGGILDAEFV